MECNGIVRGLSLTAALLGGVTVLAAAPRMVRAQAPATPPNVTLNMRDVPLRTALEQIFQAAKVDYSIAPDVTGSVNLKVTDVPFESALKLMLRSANPPATYSREGGLYLVKLRAAPVTDPVPALMPEPEAARSAIMYDRIELTYADPVDLAKLLNITMIPIFTRFGLNVPGSTGIIKRGAGVPGAGAPGVGALGAGSRGAGGVNGGTVVGSGNGDGNGHIISL